MTDSDTTQLIVAVAILIVGFLIGSGATYWIFKTEFRRKGLL